MHEAIAILDSGVGGLTVVKEVMRQLPQEKLIYFGDTERAPYGSRRAEEVAAFTTQIVKFLLRFHPKLIVIACNTATAAALESIRMIVPVPVVGVITPGVRAAVKATRSGIVGVIGTERTIESGAYERALEEVAPGIVVHSAACPELVPLVEKALYQTDEALRVVKKSLAPLSGKPIDCLILGCTHYPFLQTMISDVMGQGVVLVNSAEETARELSAILHHRNQMAKSKEEPRHQFFCSGDAELFRSIAERWLKQRVNVTSVKWPMPSAL